MDKKVKIAISAIIVIIIIIFLLSVPNGVEVETPKQKHVTKVKEKELVKNDKFKELDMQDVSISYVKGVGSTFKVTIVNNTGNNVNLKVLKVIFKDENNNEIESLTNMFNRDIEKNEKNIVTLTTINDISNAKSIEYEETDEN